MDPRLHPFTDEEMEKLRSQFPLFSRIIDETSGHDVAYGCTESTNDEAVKDQISRHGKPIMGIDWEGKFVGICGNFSHLESEMDVLIAISTLHELGHIIRKRGGAAPLPMDLEERIWGPDNERAKEIFLEEAEAWEIAEELLVKTNLPIPKPLFSSQRRKLLGSYLAYVEYHQEYDFFRGLVEEL
jgi:hypothetical protein